MVESITKPKKMKVALEERPSNNFFRLCKSFKDLKEDIPLEVWHKAFKPMAQSLASILTIMENHEAQLEDIKDVIVELCESKENIKVSFKRYRNFKLQPIQLTITEFKKGVALINPPIK